VSLLNGPEASCQFGSSLARCDDVTSDGRSELLVGAPGPNSVNSYAMVLLGTTLMTTADALAHCFLALFGPASEQYGAAVASGFDLDANGIPDMAVGAPGHAPGGAVFFGTITSGGLLPLYSSQIAGERMGASIDAAHDYDGDGVIDIVVGAPNRPGANGTQVGRAVVLSGARLASFAAPYELYTLQPTVSGVTPSTLHFGACVRASADLNGDGVGEILVGAPDFSTTLPFGPGKGAVSIFSGATGVRIASLVGANNDHVGDALAGAVEDLDGDGFREFVVAGSASDAGGTDSGVIKCYRLFPTAPSTYCTGKINSLGCTPSITFSGSPSASSAAPFLITATNFVNQKSGLLFYSHTPTAASFQGGTKCAMDPTVRTPVQSSGGSPSGADCTGAYSFDFNDWIATGWDASLAAGNEVYAQYWSRDPGSASHTSLSNALRLLVSP
jgi:hypothetical protein